MFDIASNTPFVKVFGERNSGTRAVVQMLRKCPDVGLRSQHVPPPQNAESQQVLEQISQNFTGRWRRLYIEAVKDGELADGHGVDRWKHAAVEYDPSFRDTSAHVLFCIRNPYSWAIALAKRPYHRKGPAAESLAVFVDRPWLTVGREYAPAILRSPLALWNLKYASYMRFATDAPVPSAIMKFEDFVTAPDQHLIEKLSELGVHTQQIVPLETSTKDGRTLEDIRSYYAQEKWQSWLTRPVVESINRHVDWNVALYFGYTPLNPQDFPDVAPPSAVVEMAKWFDASKSKSSSRSHSLMSRLGFQS